MLTRVGNTEDRSRDDMRGNTSDIGGRRKVGRIEENRADSSREDFGHKGGGRTVIFTSLVFLGRTSLDSWKVILCSVNTKT